MSKIINLLRLPILFFTESLQRFIITIYCEKDGINVFNSVYYSVYE